MQKRGSGGRQDPENAKQDQPQIKADDKPLISVDPPHQSVADQL